jgi:hypothetical protein
MENVLTAKIPATLRKVSSKFTWLHFLLHLSFAMSINKTQEQSMKLHMFILRLNVSPKRITCSVLEVGRAEQMHIHDITRHSRNIF